MSICQNGYQTTQLNETNQTVPHLVKVSHKRGQKIDAILAPNCIILCDFPYQWRQLAPLPPIGTTWRQLAAYHLAISAPFGGGGW